MAVPSLLFVCLGNICRSPLAEAAFCLAAERAGLDVVTDSAATIDAQVGRPPDLRAQAVALRNGVDISRKRARLVCPTDFTRFHHILALDPDNLRDLHEVAPAEATARVALLMDHVPGCEGQAVEDPYYGREEDFNTVWEQVSAAADALVAMLREQPRAETAMLSSAQGGR